MDAPNVRFNVVDLTRSVGTPTDGISFIIGRAMRGPINQPDRIISSWPAFQRLYGGFVFESNSTLMVKRLLDKGGRIRFARLAHYDDITDKETLSATKAGASGPILSQDIGENPGVGLFELNPKYHGEDGNLLKVVISNASNGRSESFNLSIIHLTEPDLNEVYTNLRVSSTLQQGEYTYLKDITDRSQLMDVIYTDISGVPLVDPRPLNVEITYSSGSNGGAIIDTDIIGDSDSQTGFRAFDEYQDSYQIMVALDDISTVVHVAGDAYAALRKDLQYWIHLDNSNVDKDSMIDAKNDVNSSSEYTVFFGGGIKASDPVTGMIKEIEAVTDIAALAANSDTNFGVHYSFAGNNRGIITNALGVVNNFGSPAKFAELNELANNQINMIINRDNQIKLWGLLTAFPNNSQLQFASVVRGIIFIKKSLRPTMENYLEEPNDMRAWKLMYYEVKPFLDSMVRSRALFSYDWQGDQDAVSLDELVVNNATDVGLGKYKVKLFLSFIANMREIEVNLVLVKGGAISFEVADSLT